MAWVVVAVVSTGIKVGADIYGGIQQGKAARAQGEFENEQAQKNARIAELQAQDAIDRGDEQAASLQRQVGQMAGAQRSATAANGVKVDSGSAADITNETQTLGAMDVMRTKNNAWREAWGFKVQAEDYRQQGEMALKTGRQVQKSSYVTAGLNAVSDAASVSKYFIGGGGGGGGFKPNMAGGSYRDPRGLV